MSSVLRTLLIPALLLVSSAAPSARARAVEFVDMTREAGIRWGLRALGPGALYLVETRGGGGGFIDYDSDGDLDIYLVCYTRTPQPDPAARLTDALFRNNGDGSFTETTYPMGLARESIPMSGFGTRFFDYDNDGRTDLFVLNGHPFEPVAKVLPGVTYAEPPFLYENAGRTFREVAATRGAALRRHYLGRGLALGDYDNDGDSDLLMMNAGEPPVPLRNEGGSRNNWLGVRLTGTRSNRDAVGARVTVTAGGARRTKYLLGGTSYCSASDPRLLFGLGAVTKVDELEVRWPSGQTSTLKNLSAGRYVSVTEGAAHGVRP